MFLEYPAGQVELRPGGHSLMQGVARIPVTTPAGHLVIIGDGGWDPATLTLQLRISSPTAVTPGDASMGAADALLEAAKQATCIREPNGRVTYLHGLRNAYRRHRGTWWEIELAFLPRALDRGQGTGETVTHLGQIVTHNGVPVHVEVH